MALTLQQFRQEIEASGKNFTIPPSPYIDSVISYGLCYAPTMKELAYMLAYALAEIDRLRAKQ